MRPVPILLGLMVVPAAAQEIPPQPAPAADTRPAAPSAVDLLLQQANRWLDQGRPDLAAASVQRALTAEPRSTAALLLGVRVEAARGSRDAASAYAARLRTGQATPEQLAQAESEMRAASVDRAALEEARRLAREKRPEEAAASYRVAFGNREPPPLYAREYYEILAATSAGRSTAQRALGQLAAQPGADDRTVLANAEQLTFNTQSRASGIQRLAELAARPGVGAEAKRAWRQALGFYGNDPASIPLYEDYLKRYPDDFNAKQVLASLRALPAAAPPGPGDGLRQRGFAELDGGQLRSSAQQFESALALDPADADALGGLGIVRLRENRPSEARSLLERAIAANPAKSAQWRRALDAANYPAELAQARQALQRGNAEEAAMIARRAAAREVDDSSDAETLLGEAALRRGDKLTAEQHFRAALTRRPGFPPASAGLARALGRAPSGGEGAGTARFGLPPQRESAAQPPANPDVARLRAEAASAADPRAEAELLSAAVARAPSDPYLRLDLARALRRGGREADARGMIADFAARSPSPDADYASALFANETGRTAEAEMLLARISPKRRTADMERLQSQLRGRVEVARATTALHAAPAQGREQLVQLAGQVDPTGTVGADAVRALAASGDTQGAARAAQAAAAANPGGPAQLALAGALHEAGLEAEAASALARAERGTLTPSQQRDAAAIRAGAAIRASDRFNEAGNQAAGYETLRPVLASAPGDPAAQLALSRLYQGSKQPAQAQKIAETVLARNPRDWEARRGAVEAALAAGDRGRAETLANEGQAMAPQDSRATLLRARVARANGENGRARALLEQAAAQRGQELGGRAAGRTQVASADNPFRSVGATSDPALPQDSVSQEITQELRLARQDSAPRIAGTTQLRVRSGVSGLDSLVELATPLEASGQLGNMQGRFTAQVTPVLLNSGNVSANSYAAGHFGANPANGTALAGRDSSATGVGLSIGYQRGEAFSVDAGTAPLGFRTTNVVGGLEFAPKLSDNLRLRVKAERRSVTDSLLSYAGARDPVTGQVWGGVTQTGGRAQLETSIGTGTAYVLGGYAVLDGKNVQRNERREAGAGVSFPLLRRPDSELTAGLDLVYFGYSNNQRSFTFGQGGYFSPQNFMAINFPVEYRSHFGSLGYKVGGTIGYAHFREGSGPLFPTSASLQSQVEAANQANPAVATRTTGQTKNGLIGGVRVELDYPVTESLSLIGGVRYDKAADFEETRVSLRLENRF